MPRKSPSLRDAAMARGKSAASDGKGCACCDGRGIDAKRAEWLHRRVEELASLFVRFCDSGEEVEPIAMDAAELLRRLRRKSRKESNDGTDRCNDEEGTSDASDE